MTKAILKDLKFFFDLVTDMFVYLKGVGECYKKQTIRWWVDCWHWNETMAWRVPKVEMGLSHMQSKATKTMAPQN